MIAYFDNFIIINVYSPNSGTNYDNKILFQDAIGLATWRPGPNKSFESWTAGKHTVVVQWSKTTGLPDVGEFSWIFYTY